MRLAGIDSSGHFANRSRAQLDARIGRAGRPRVTDFAPNLPRRLSSIDIRPLARGGWGIGSKVSRGWGVLHGVSWV